MHDATPPVVPARRSDAQALFELREEISLWQQERGIVGRHPGEVGIDVFVEEIERGERWVVRGTRRPVLATACLCWTDRRYWDGQGADGRAGYMHGLMVVRDDPAARGLGSSLIRWVESRVQAAKRPVARLNCIAKNEKLVAYFEGLGYEKVRIKHFLDGFHHHPMQLLEKPLGTAPQRSHATRAARAKPAAPLSRSRQRRF